MYSRFTCTSMWLSRIHVLQCVDDQAVFVHVVVLVCGPVC